MNEKNKKIISGFFQKRTLLKIVVFLVLAVFLFNATINLQINNTGKIATYFSIYPKSAKAGFMDFAQNIPGYKSYANWMYDKASGSPSGTAEKTFKSSEVCASYRIDCWILYGIWGVMSWILAAAGLLMDYMIDPKNFNLVVGQNAAILEIWKGVRDLLNLAFMLVLLFSAFATVFQSASYHLIKKNILLQVILMALLVNFSFPIARFIIDISNVTGYYFLSQMIPDGNISGKLAAFSDLTKALLPIKGQEGLITQLIMAIILTGILAVTFLVIGITFVVRLVFLAVLIIFSPIGFVGNIMAGGTLKKYADDWWSNLFKFSFFFPAMALMLYISLRLAESFSVTMKSGFQQQAAQMGGQPILGTLAYFSVPIAVIWVGFFAALEIGGVATAFAGEHAKKFMKGAGKKFSGYNWVNKRVGAYSAERKKRADEKFKKNWGTTLGSKFNNAQDFVASRGNKDTTAGKRYNKRKDEKNREDIKNASEKYDGTTNSDLHRDVKGAVNLNQAAIDNMSADAIKEAAGKIKQALARGSAYEKHVEADLKNSISYPTGTVGLSGAAKPRDARPAAITIGMTPAQIAMERDREKSEKDAMDKWIRDEKAAIFEQGRKLIVEAQNRGKLK